MTTPLVFTDEVTYIATPCPEWCTLKPDHPVDSVASDGRELRGHGRDSFGDFLHAGADGYVEAPGVLEYDVQIQSDGDPLTSAQLRTLAQDALAAAEWLEAHR
ncbi:MAG: hypothetical protein ACR2K3_07120 [Nocardioides sp.]